MEDTTPKIFLEPDVRALRDMVYGKPSSDDNWEGCKKNWMKPENIKWLREQLEKQNKLP